MIGHEIAYYQKIQSKKIIAGIDEVGRGSLAGPVTVGLAAYRLDQLRELFGKELEEVRDSKRLTASKREILAKEIKKKALFYTLQHISHRIIDQSNINYAIDQGVIACLTQATQAGIKIDYLLIDGATVSKEIPLLFPQIKKVRAIVKGDDLFFSIACASILAKVIRDQKLKQLHRLYPNYQFHRNKGYGTKIHLTALKKFGACSIHRKTFQPVILARCSL